VLAAEDYEYRAPLPLLISTVGLPLAATAQMDHRRFKRLLEISEFPCKSGGDVDAARRNAQFQQTPQLASSSAKPVPGKRSSGVSWLVRLKPSGSCLRGWKKKILGDDCNAGFDIWLSLPCTVTQLLVHHSLPERVGFGSRQ
jgi:hypothetical protein